MTCPEESYFKYLDIKIFLGVTNEISVGYLGVKPS